jgi:DNA-binding transcriptional ArsR family regulator
MNLNVKGIRQLLKVCAEDTRLRILNVLWNKECTVKEICRALAVSQPTVSKHLMKLRLLKMVIDRRQGNLVYYKLNQTPRSPQASIAEFIILKFKGLATFRKDLRTLAKGKGR